MPRTTILVAVLITVSQLSIASDSISVKIPSMQQLLSEIIEVAGIEEKFKLKESDVLNIEATISHRKKYIIYNPAFINWINYKTNDKWAVAALLAHEIGHHVNRHTIKRSGSKPHLELEADEFAGYILHKMGASLKQSQQVMFYISTKKGSATHPDRAARLKAIEKGWNKASPAVIHGGTSSTSKPII